MAQTEKANGRRGPPPRAGVTSTKRLASVKVTDAELQAYDECAAAEGMTRAEWVRYVLDRAVVRWRMKGTVVR
jgi:hypothetical protein